MHGVTGFVESAALLVFAAFVLVTICSRIGVPSIVGYILAGIVIGPAGFGLIAENAALSSIGEIDPDAQLELAFAADDVQRLSRNELRIYDAVPLTSRGAAAEDIAAHCRAGSLRRCAQRERRLGAVPVGGSAADRAPR